MEMAASIGSVAAAYKAGGPMPGIRPGGAQGAALMVAMRETSVSQ